MSTMQNLLNIHLFFAITWNIQLATQKFNFMYINIWKLSNISILLTSPYERVIRQVHHIGYENIQI